MMIITIIMSLFCKHLNAILFDCYFVLSGRYFYPAYAWEVKREIEQVCFLISGPGL